MQRDETRYPHPKECHGYDAKQSDASVMRKLWELRSTTLLPCPINWGYRIHIASLQRDETLPAPNKCPGRDTKQSLELWGMKSNKSTLAWSGGI